MSLALCNISVQDVNQASPGNQAVSNWVENMSYVQLREEQFKDSNVGVVLIWLENYHHTSVRELQLSSPETRSIWFLRDQLSIQDGVGYYDWSLFLCVEVLWPSQPNGVMSCAVSLPNHTFSRQA